MATKEYCLNWAATQEYIEDLNNGRFNNFPRFFDTKSKNADIEEAFRKPYNSEESEMARKRIFYSISVIYRYLTSTSSGNEIVFAMGKRKKYEAGKGSDIQFSAWVLVHAYLIPDICPLRYWRALLPKEKDGIDAWNNSVDSIMDICNNIKKLFIIDPETGRCEVLNQLYTWADDNDFKISFRNGETVDEGYNSGYPTKNYNSSVTTQAQDNVVVEEEEKTSKEIHEEENAESESPKDDAPVVGDVINDIPSNSDSDVTKEVKKDETSASENMEEKNQNETGKIYVDYDEYMALKKAKEELEERGEDLNKNANIKFMSAITFVPPEEAKIKFAAFDIDASKYEQAVVLKPGEMEDIYKEANKLWHDRFPGLEKFTNLVHKNDLYVNYSTLQIFDTVDVFRADLISKTGAIVSSFLVDYYCIFADGIRIGTMMDRYGDVFNEIWINIYNMNYVSKLITNTLTEDDTLVLAGKYPAYINNIVRMVDLSEFPKDVNNSKWRAFMNRLSKVVMNLPKDARFRLVNYKDINCWTLACARNVPITFVSKNDIRLRSVEFSNIRNRGLYVDYDENKFKDTNGYIVGYLDGSNVEFDPYGFKEAAK